MAVISILIEESSEQIVSGIPRIVTLSANISCIIYYTLDGNDPNAYSLMYTNPISMPTNAGSVTLKVYATNGIDSSAIISQKYASSILDNSRLPHSATTATPQEAMHLMRPFGSTPINPNPNYLNPALAGQTVYDPALPAISNGYDGYNQPGNFTNLPYTLDNYKITYSTTDDKGMPGPGIGNLPGKTTVVQPIPAPEETELYTTTFDPRAYVIFQDVSKESPLDPPQINKQFFTLENPTASDGNKFFITDGQPPPSGSFLRSQFNPRTNTLTYYYYDNLANRWIISSTPYNPNSNKSSLGILISGGRYGRYVLEWRPYARRSLF